MRAKNKIYQDLYRVVKYRVFLPDDKQIFSLSDKHKYIIHKIYERKLFDKTIEDFVPLSAKFIMFVLGRYRPIIDDLIRLGIIECDNFYIVSSDTERGKSLGYKLTNIYEDVKFKADFITDARIIRKIHEHKKNNKPKVKHHKFLYENLEKLEIDYESALDSIKGITDVKQYNMLRISIEKIYKKEFHFNIDNTAGRVHTNVTNFSSGLRKFLLFNGKKLKNIDIKNSQPFLFNILIKQFFEMKKTPFSSLFLYNQTSNILFSPYDLRDMKKDYKNNKLEDVNLFEKLTSSGKFYDYLMRIAGIDIKERQNFKKNFFGKVFFCKLNENYKYDNRRFFENEFPIVSQIIDYYKKDDYTQLPIKLQKAEADIMINKIIKRISSERPKMFALTIHDSILTTEDSVKYVKKIILEEFEKEFNLKPTIKVE